MKVWQIEKTHTLQLCERVIPDPAPEQVRIKVRAIGVNRADILQVKGLYPAPEGFDNSVPGLEYAGIVDAVGSQVRGRAVGDYVMGLIPGAAYSEYLCLHELESLMMPEGIGFIEAASIPEAFLTAYRALIIEGQLKAGQFCLIRPATSSVGLAAVQVAAAHSAFAIGSSRQLDKLASAKAMGLAFAVKEDETLAEQLLQITHGQGVASIVDMLGPDWQQLLKGLARGGRLVLLGVLAGLKTELNLFELLSRQQTLSAMTMRSQPLDKRIQVAEVFNRQLLSLFNQQKLRPLPVQSFAFDEAPKALEHMQQGEFSGKRVLVL